MGGVEFKDSLSINVLDVNLIKFIKTQVKDQETGQSVEVESILNSKTL